MINNDLAKLAADLGKRGDYFQGAGGNVSLKLDETVMLIKASGVRISDMSSEDGIVAVSFPKIRDYFNDNQAGDSNTERESAGVVSAATLSVNGRRPSMETGFHALLGTAVVHSHSVYVNIFACSDRFAQMVPGDLFKGIEAQFQTIGYATPGHFLTHAVKDAIRGLDINAPIVIIMKNHGIIVSAPSIDQAVSIHEDVNTTLARHLKTLDPYPPANVIRREKEPSSSDTPYLLEFIRHNKALITDIQKHLLFPDLVVFCKDLAVSSGSVHESKAVIDIETGAIAYRTSQREAETIEENLLAWAYLMTEMNKRGFKATTISGDGAKALESMESESYRKQLAAKLKG